MSEMNSRMRYGRNTGDRLKEQTIPGHVNSEPSILMEGVSNIDLQQHHHSFVAHQMNVGASTSSNFYYPFVAPLASPRVSVVPINYGSPDLLMSSYNNIAAFGGSSEEFGRNQFKESTGGSYKRKNAETGVGSSHCSPYESTSTSVNAPIDSRHAYYGHPPQYGGGNGILSIADDSNDGSVRDRSGAAGISFMHPHDYNGYIHGSHSAQSLQPAGAFPFDQTLMGNPVLGLAGCLAWNHSPTVPYMHGGNITRVPLEVRMGMGGSTEIDREGRATSIRHPVHASPRDHNPHQLTHMQGMRDHRFPFCPQVPAPHFPVPSGAINVAMANAVGPRPRGSSRQVTIGTNQPQMRAIPETMRIPCDISYMRYLPVDEVAIIDLPEHYNVRHHTDHHSDMRMDIEHMSYEELLALGERIGNVNTGLSEESIVNQLRTRWYQSLSAKEAPSEDGETACCIICLGDYENQDELGSLNCGHEYHADCLKEWLLVKNVCPVCKTQALPS